MKKPATLEYLRGLSGAYAAVHHARLQDHLSALCFGFL